jgi:hypothetical protein
MSSEQEHCECEVKHMKDEIVTIKTLVIASFSIVTAILIPLFSFLGVYIDMKLEPLRMKSEEIIRDAKRTELRVVRVENSIINNESKLSSIDKSLAKVVDSFPYIYATKKDLDSKVDKKEVDSRLLKSAYREE